MLYIKDMNSVEILILNRSETKRKFNAFHLKKGRVRGMCIKRALWSEASWSKGIENLEY